MSKPLCLTLACALALTFGCADDDGASGPSDNGIMTEEDPSTEGPSTEGPSSEDPSSEDPPAVYEQPAPWAEMNKQQRFEFMKMVVVPEMTSVFQKVNPDAKVNCGTCHGENPGAVEFKMPNGLAPLNVADFPLEESDDPKIAASARFMREEVVPAMAGLLDLEPRSQENPEGFGCFSCHARDDAP